MSPPDAPASEPRKTLVEMFDALMADNADLARNLLVRLHEADAAENALDEARICADADGVRFRELVAERAELVSLLAVNEAEGETLAGTVRALYAANERGVARYARLRDWTVRTGHAEGCLGSFDGEDCTCGLAALVEKP